MSNRENCGQGSHVPGDRYALRITRLEPGQSATLRMLSESLLGLMTHWQRGRSVYCPGQDDCPNTTHALDAVWKGYVAAELWIDARKQYFPTVLEVTESCELDMRGRYARGQLWQLDRAGSVRGKKCPVAALLVGKQEAGVCPPSFDPLPLLQQLYHRLDVRCALPNPLPGRIFAAPHAGEAPAADQVDQPVNPRETRELWRKMMDEHRNGNGKAGGQ
jgi:hypothetical protein